MRILLVYKILSIFLVLVNGEGNVTLTTATVCEGDCLKPTTLSLNHRRMILERNEENSSIPYFRTRSKKKKTRSEIWQWDYWCQLQPKVGNCGDKIVRFRYDAQLDNCVSFIYSGCKGNKNNFQTKEECDQNCKGSAFMELNELRVAEQCSLQPNSGLCVAMFWRYYYDINVNECKKLIYGGCGGNANRFTTKYRCTSTCGQNKHN